MLSSLLFDYQPNLQLEIRYWIDNYWKRISNSINKTAEVQFKDKLYMEMKAYQVGIKESAV